MKEDGYKKLDMDYVKVWVHRYWDSGAFSHDKLIEIVMKWSVYHTKDRLKIVEYVKTLEKPLKKVKNNKNQIYMSTTAKQIVLKKSELARLKGLGNTHEMVSKIYGVKESEIKDAMMTFGLSKAKPKAKKEPEYVIVLENDIENVKAETVTAPVADSKAESTVNL